MNSSRLEQLSVMLKDEPEDSFLNYALALEYAKADDIKKAIGIIETILSRDPNYLGAYFQLGQYYEQVGKTQSAITTYNKGVTIAQQQQNKKAVGEFNEALFMLEDD